MPFPFPETVSKIIRANQVSRIRWFNQKKLLDKYNPMFLPQDSPPDALSLDQRGVCYALVDKWYWYQQTNRDLLTALIQDNCNDLIRKISRIQKHHRELNDNLTYADQPLDRGDKSKRYELRLLNLGCQENWLEKRFLRKNLPHSLFCFAQPNVIEDKTEESYEEWREHPKIKNQFFGKNQIDFRKVIDETIDEDYPGSLKEIFIMANQSRHVNHFIGFTYRLNKESQKEYVIFDPSHGEFTFNTLKDSKQFLCDYIAAYYIALGVDKDLYTRVDVTTFVVPTLVKSVIISDELTVTASSVMTAELEDQSESSHTAPSTVDCADKSDVHIISSFHSLEHDFQSIATDSNQHIDRAADLLQKIHDAIMVHTATQRKTALGFELNGGGTLVVVNGIAKLFARSAAKVFNQTSKILQPSSNSPKTPLKPNYDTVIDEIETELTPKIKPSLGFFGLGAREKSTADLYRDIVDEIVRYKKTN